MSGDWDLPYEPIPGGPIWSDIDEMLTCGSIVVRAGVVEVPPDVAESGRAPVLVFDFGLAEGDGAALPSILLVLDVEHMLSIGETIRKAIRDAVRHSRSASS